MGPGIRGVFVLVEKPGTDHLAEGGIPVGVGNLAQCEDQGAADGDITFDAKAVEQFVRSHAGRAETMDEERASLGVGIEPHQAIGVIRSAQENQRQGRVCAALLTSRASVDVGRRICQRA